MIKELAQKRQYLKDNGYLSLQDEREELQKQCVYTICLCACTDIQQSQCSVSARPHWLLPTSWCGSSEASH